MRTKNNKYCVYIHTNIENGKVYIGITCQSLKSRWLKGKGYESQTKFYNAIKKYGWDGFYHDVLYYDITKEQAEQIEIELIKIHNSIDDGYNLSNGGNSTGKHSDETKRKISSSHMGIRPSEEVRLKLSEGRTGEKNHQWGKRGELSPMYGKRHKEETKRKMSTDRQGGKNANAKRVYCDGVIYDCAKDCAIRYGIPVTTLRGWLNGCNKMREDFKCMGLKYID